MIDLTRYGWGGALNRLKQESPHSALPHGRVTTVHRTCYEVVSENGRFQCELTGAMLYGTPDHELPCVGDWVLFQPFDENKGILVDRLPRQRTLYRKRSGTLAERQTIASYVDKAFIVQSLDANFNVRRVERFLVQIREERVEPVLVLHKADLGYDRETIALEIRHLARQIPVFFTTVHDPQTILRLRESIAEGETVVFVGSSGVGKSSLVNALCEETLLAASDVSLSTGKGRHTSTRREMVSLPGSGVLIDTPGVREFGLAVDDPDALAEMLDISDYASSCRFQDCEHTTEPGCAVLEALRSGLLDLKVYESYQKLRREAAHFSTSEHEKRRKEKSFSKLIEHVKRQKEKGG